MSLKLNNTVKEADDGFKLFWRANLPAKITNAFPMET
jgi:hypothetical protein